jgi:hypothetical protein
LHLSPRRTLPALFAALLAGAAPRPAWASAAGEVVCETGRISEIFVDNNSVFQVGSQDLEPRFNWAYRLANRMHVRTREDVIRRELLFREGDCYDPALLEDSERVLRSAAFIADADVFAVKQADGTYHVVVETRDEWSTRLEPQLESGAAVGLRGAELREDNLLGTGQHVSAFFREAHHERVYGASYGTPQLFKSHLRLDMGVARTPVGFSAEERLAYPFRGEAGRFAVREQVTHEEDYFEFYRARDGRLEQYLFPQRRRSFDLSGVVRIGQRGNLTLFGLGFTGDWVAYPRGGALVSTDPSRPPLPAADSGLAGLDSVSNVRVVFLAGQRNVHFDRRRALDAVRGTEDVRLGAEVELGIGRSLTAISTDDDVAMDLGIFASGDLPGGVLMGGRMTVQGNRDFAVAGDTSEWRNVFGQADVWAYWRPSPESRHTLVAAVSGIGGWHVDVPFQVTLGSRAGLRGYTRQVATGGRRAVATLEERTYLGWPFPRLFDLGTAVFVDAGRSWAGGDRFATNSKLEASGGFGLRMAFPPGSRRTYRLDVAAPVTGGFKARNLQITIGIGQAVGRGAVGDDSQITRSARPALSASVFSYPN